MAADVLATQGPKPWLMNGSLSSMNKYVNKLSHINVEKKINECKSLGLYEMIQ